MSSASRLVRVVSAVVLIAVLAGCVAYPYEPGYGYGYGHRYHHHHHRNYGGW